MKGKNSICIDYFAGSGTTCHAIINLNREDEGHRKYILVEMGTYFDTVTKPRIQKVVYSNDWKDGKSLNREGISHYFKYMRLESYEDTLNNLALKQTKTQQKKMKTVYGYIRKLQNTKSLSIIVNDFVTKIHSNYLMGY